MFKKIYVIIFLCFTSFLKGENLEQLLDAIEKQNFEVIRELTSSRTFTKREKKVLIAQAFYVADKCEQKAWFSEQTKKSIFATLCIGLFASSGLFLPGSLAWVMTADTANGSFDTRLITPEVVRYCAMHFALFSTCIAGGVLAGMENISGYYTNRHNFILNNLSKNLK